ncbi:MAG: DedA family protein [Acidimicrobiales bacterium]
MNLHDLIVHYGYAAVFCVVGVESLGVPFPGETALVVAATYAGATHRLSVFAIFGAAAAGAIIGDTIGYWIGDKGGYRLLYRYGHYVRLDEPKIKVARYLFDRHGDVVVFVGRFIVVLRTYAAFFAGTSQMRYRRFLVSNAAGGLLWAALYSFLPYYAGHFLSKASTPFEVVLVAFALVVVAVGVVVLRRRMAKLTVSAEAAFPGTLAPPRRRKA